MSPRWFGSKSDDTENDDSDFPRERIDPAAFDLNQFPESPQFENLSYPSFVGMGYYLEDQINKLEFSDDDWIALRRYLTFYPLEKGFGSFKWILKRLESIFIENKMPDGKHKIISAIAIAYAKIESERQFAFHVNSVKTLKYLQRRGMRFHDYLVANHPEEENLFRLNFLIILDDNYKVYGQQDTLKRQWILAKLLFEGSGDFSRGAGSRSINYPDMDARATSNQGILSSEFSSAYFKDFWELVAGKNPDIVMALWNTSKEQNLDFKWNAYRFYAAFQTRSDELKRVAVGAAGNDANILLKINHYIVNDFGLLATDEALESFSSICSAIDEDVYFEIVRKWLAKATVENFSESQTRFAQILFVDSRINSVIQRLESLSGASEVIEKFTSILENLARQSKYQPLNNWIRIFEIPSNRKIFPWLGWLNSRQGYDENWNTVWVPRNIPYPPLELAKHLLPLFNFENILNHIDVRSDWLEDISSFEFVLYVHIRSDNKTRYTKLIEKIKDSNRAEEYLLKTLSILVENSKFIWIPTPLDALCDSKFDQTWRKYGDQIHSDILSNPNLRKFIWDDFEILSEATLNRLKSFPDFGKSIITVLNRKDFLTLTERQAEFLMPYLEKETKTITDAGLWGSLVVCPIPSVNQWACKTMGNLGLLESYWLDMAESQLPYPMEVAKQYLLSNAVTTEADLLQKLLVLIDSDIAVTRNLGFEVLNSSKLRVERTKLVNALAEHTSIDVWDYLTKNYDALTDSDARQQFHKEVFLSRRKARRTKKFIMDTSFKTPDEFDDIELLKRLSLGSNLRDREFALKLLALRNTDSDLTVEETWQSDNNV